MNAVKLFSVFFCPRLQNKIGLAEKNLLSQKSLSPANAMERKFDSDLSLLILG